MANQGANIRSFKVYCLYIFCFISYGQCHETLTFHFCRQFFTLNFLKLFCLCTFERAVKRYDFLNKNNFSYSTATILNPFHKDIMGVKTPFYLKRLVFFILSDVQYKKTIRLQLFHSFSPLLLLLETSFLGSS